MLDNTLTEFLAQVLPATTRHGFEAAPILPVDVTQGEAPLGALPSGLQYTAPMPYANQTYAAPNLASFSPSETTQDRVLGGVDFCTSSAAGSNSGLDDNGYIPE